MISRVLKLITVFIFAGTTAFAKVPPTKLTKDITWEITDDNVLKVYGTGEIPDFKKDSNKAWHQRAEKIKGLEYGDNISAIEIGEGITSIGTHAFEPTYNDVLYSSSNKLHSIVLPSTLKSIGAWAFKGIVADEMKLPDGLKIIGGSSFENGGKRGTLEIPESVEEIRYHAFYDAAMSGVKINGDPVIQEYAFDSKKLKLIDITGHPKFRSYGGNGHFFPWRDAVTIRAYNRDLDLSMCDLGEKVQLVYTTPEEDQTVATYVANRIPSWDNYLQQKVTQGKLLSTEDAKKEIASALESWQTKGEFESVADWQKRVNETTRKKFVDNLLSERQIKVNDVKSDYERLRTKYVDEFYDKLKENETNKFLADTFTLMPYDADNETYLIKTGNNGDILLKVPRKEAPAVKEGWPSEPRYNYLCITPNFVPRDDKSVALKSVIFKFINAGTFEYSGETANYAVTDVNYNFAPLEIEQIDDASFSAPTLAETTPTKIIGGSGITKRQVDVAHNTVTGGNGSAVKSIPSGRSDVDLSLPKGDKERPNTFALVIANENYRRVASVPYALNDGKSVCNYLKTTLGLPEKNIIYVENASLNDISYNLRRIAEICKAYKGDASLIVYYAGHGVPDDNTKDAYLLPVDGYAESPSSSGLSLSSLTGMLAELPTQSAVLLLDACFSGGERSASGSDMLVSARGVRIKPNKNAVSGNLVVLSATQGEESAQPYEEKQHGLFTYYLLKKLRESKGNLTIGELADFVIDNVERTSAVNGKKQTPSVNASAQNSSWRTIRF